MNKICLLILISVLFQNCKEKEELNVVLKPTYSDFENDLEQRNLYGKVKMLEQYKALFQSSQSMTEPVPTLKEEFTEFGSFVKTEYFDDYGEITQTDQFYYDNNEFLVKSISTNYLANQKTVQFISYDSISNTTTRNLTINDSLNYKFISTFDSQDFLIKQVKIEDNDSVVRKYDFKLNENNRRIFDREIEESKELSIGSYKYDEENQLIESSTKYEWMEFLTVTEWKYNRIIKQIDYTISADSNKHLDRIIEYDNQYNPVNEKIYENSELNRELSYAYEFDQFGNWIKKTVSMKEHFANSDKFIPIYIDSRKITYWK